MIRTKRVYDAPAADDGFRILVDRLWPRGVSKAAARVDLWLKEIAPSDALRRWFGHDVTRFSEFRTRYRSELAARPATLSVILDHAKAGPVTIVFAARDSDHSNARVLLELLRELGES